MDKCRDGCRALHRIGQPYMQREHCALAGATYEHKSEGYGDNRSCRSEQHCIRGERECARIVSVKEYAYKEKEVGKARYDKRLLRRCYCSLFRIVEAYKQIGRYSHKFPKHIHLKDIGSYHKPQHRECEERQEGIVALETFLAFHISERVYVYHEADSAYHYEHHHRNGVEHYAHVNMKIVGKRQPNEIIGHERGKKSVRTTSASEIKRGCRV